MRTQKASAYYDSAKHTRPMYYCNVHRYSRGLQFIIELLPFVLFSPRLQVFDRMIMRSVLMLGLRTLGVTTPHASLSLRFTDSVYFFVWCEGVEGGSGHGEPKVALTRLWWLGAISRGRLAMRNSS